MPASKKEDIIAEAMQSYQTKEVPVGKTMLVFHELSVDARRKLDESIFVTKDGEFVSNAKGGDVMKDGVAEIYNELWIAATAEPALTVDDLKPWPQSLKVRLCDEARRINGMKPAEETAKNS